MHGGHTRCAGRSPRLHALSLCGCLHAFCKSIEGLLFAIQCLATNSWPSTGIGCGGVTDLVFVDDRWAWQDRNAAADSLKALGKTLWLSWLHRTSGGCSMNAILDLDCIATGALAEKGGRVHGAEPVKYTCAQDHTA